jgi:energy-coupling factor transporter ATP-binding protein EcfA2
MPVSNQFPRGSEWRKWDLQVHAPLGKLYDGYRTSDGSDPLDKFCDEIEESDVRVFGITDYFSIGGFRTFTERFPQKYPNSRKRFFFNLELRLNETVNQELEEVHVHLIFNPDSLDRADKFLSRLEVIKTGLDEAPIMCSELKTNYDFESASVTRKSITDAFENTFGKADRQDHFLVVTAANNDGLRPKRGKKRKEGICDEIDKFSDAFFGGSQNVHYYLNPDRYEDDLEAAKKPVVASSDAHSFEDLENSLGKRFVKEIEKDGKKIEVVEKDITWIKADPTYEGLKQILYEPESGERVYVGPVKPDQKDDYKVIGKIKFTNSEDFPDEIELNENLSSIIGSRSSGKSALLAYVAHAIDPDGVEQIQDGPGEGEDYHWDVIELDYEIEWANGKTNDESPGSVVYLPQNYLFEKSKDPNEIKAKIEPVLFKVVPEFETEYTHAIATIEGHNSQIADEVSNWFAASDEIRATDSQLKELGDEKAIEQQKTKTAAQIAALKEKNKLSEADLKKYQEISGEIARLMSRNKEIDSELGSISAAKPNKDFFTAAKITLTPAVGSLPAKLQAILKTILESNQSTLVEGASREVLAYKDEITHEKGEKGAAILRINDDNKDLIEKYQGNAEVESLVKTLNGHQQVLRKISEVETYRKTKEDELRVSERAIADALAAKSLLIQNLESTVKASNQNSLDGIEFGLESGFDEEEVEQLSHGINLKEKTDFIDNHELKIEAIRKDPAKFLADVYAGKQKINTRYEKQTVVTAALKLTEKVLFTAKMEGDKIGGFSEPTMTPGKRALFALRLILAESDDTWPLLIDQPEDDLDSRSIYDEVVPFLKLKKKERQIIMVSHNANLVIGSDSEQLIIANRNGNDRKNADGGQFNYLTGSLEFTQDYDEDCDDTLKAQGVCEHACSILDGGRAAFQSRKNRYHVK